MPELRDRIRFGLLIGVGATAAIIAGFAFLLAPGAIANARYGSPWGLIIGGPWVLTWVIALSVVITAYETDPDA